MPAVMHAELRPTPSRCGYAQAAAPPRSVLPMRPPLGPSIASSSYSSAPSPNQGEHVLLHKSDVLSSQ
eukprot:1157868-Pelagomonas_calceolata.AAC.2